MKKRLISLIVAVVMLFSMLCPAAYADDETVSFDTCTHEWETPLRSGYSITIPGSDVSFSVKTEQCKKCKWYKHVATIFIAEFTYYSPLNVDTNGLVPTELATYWANVWYNNFGKNATATKFTPGGGSTSGGGVGRPKGYADDNGTPSVSSDGGIIWQTTFDDNTKDYIRTSFYKYDRWNPDIIEFVFSKIRENPDYYKPWFVTLNSTDFIIEYSSSSNYTSYYVSGDSSSSNNAGLVFTAPIKGYYRLLAGKRGYYENAEITNYYTEGNKSYLYDVGADITISNVAQFNYYFSSDSGFTSKHHIWHFYLPKYEIIPYSAADKPTSFTNITINNNTWNGNIYTDNSTNLTYIYPQYTTVNEKNETVTNISNTPIIYNNETKKYYTYDTVTNNYYYITYEQPATPTPSPSPSPAPTEIPTPSPDPTEEPSPSPTPAPTEKPGGSISTPETGKPGGDAGDTTGILAVLVEIRDNMIQGFLDIKAAFVAGFAELSANFTLAIENLNLNITNIFNKKFPDQSTPETAPPSPSPSPSPSPAPLDPVLPETQNLIIPKMNSNTFTDEHGTWIASGSSKYSDVFDFFRAFDRSTSEIWETNVSPSHLQIEIPDPENYYIDGYIMRISKFDNRYAKDWTLQGSDDGETWDDLDTQKDQNLSDKEEHKYSLTLRKAYKYYRLNMSNYASSMCSLSHFNLLGYDAKDVVTPTPAPTDPPSPSPAPDPGKPDSGDKTNNFWTIIFPNGGGSEDGKKGIFWALVSLILALIAFFANLAVGVGYLFPFLPDGVVMTINTCLIVIFLFTIIKFIMRSK